MKVVKTPGSIIALGVVDNAFPDPGVDLGAADRVLAARIRGTPLIRGLDTVSGLEELVPAATGLRIEGERVAAVEVVRDAYVFGMIGDNDEVQRPYQFETLPGLAFDRFSPRDAISIFRAKGRAGQSCIGRPRGM